MLCILLDLLSAKKKLTVRNGHAHILVCITFVALLLRVTFAFVRATVSKVIRDNISHGTHKSTTFVAYPVSSSFFVGVTEIFEYHTQSHSPRYMHPLVQVSRTSIWLRSGSCGFNFFHIQRARFSLVGLSSPGMSFR